MKHLFVPYELALELKDKGFDEKCFAWTTTENSPDFLISSCEKYNGRENKMIQIPLYQQVIDWLREEHNIIIYIDCEDGCYSYNIRYLEENDGTWCIGNTYYQALNKAIEEALKLIK